MCFRSLWFVNDCRYLLHSGLKNRCKWFFRVRYVKALELILELSLVSCQRGKEGESLVESFPFLSAKRTFVFILWLWKGSLAPTFTHLSSLPLKRARTHTNTSLSFSKKLFSLLMSTDTLLKAPVPPVVFSWSPTLPPSPLHIHHLYLHPLPPWGLQLWDGCWPWSSSSLSCHPRVPLPRGARACVAESSATAATFGLISSSSWPTIRMWNLVRLKFQGSAGNEGGTKCIHALTLTLTMSSYALTLIFMLHMLFIKASFS